VTRKTRQTRILQRSGGAVKQTRPATGGRQSVKLRSQCDRIGPKREQVQLRLALAGEIRVQRRDRKWIAFATKHGFTRKRP